MKWEYRTLEVETADLWDVSGRLPEHRCYFELNRLGSDGWELVQVIPMARSLGRTDYATFIFKRQSQ